MTIHNSVCDFCGHQSTPTDTVSVIFYVDGIAQFWCGHCRDGSRAYFVDFDSPTMAGLIEKTQEVLQNDPIKFAPPYDSIEVHMRKMWLEDEVYRAKRELTHRVREA